MTNLLSDYLSSMPLIAILRGIQPEQALAVGEILLESGFKVIEVPLNSPQPFESIELLAKNFADTALIGAGTVMTVDDVTQVKNAGGGLIVMPHWDENLVTAARRQGLISTPGVATPSEGFAALRAQADGLKLFPAEMLPPKVVKAWRAVFSADTLLLPVGGINVDNMVDYWQAGASGFGLGSALFKADMPLAEIKRNAEAFCQEMDRLRAQSN